MAHRCCLRAAKTCGVAPLARQGRAGARARGIDALRAAAEDDARLDPRAFLLRRRWLDLPSRVMRLRCDFGANPTRVLR